MNNDLNELTELFRKIPGISFKMSQRLAVSIIEKPEIIDALRKIIEISSNLSKDELTGLIINKNFLANQNREKDLLVVIDSNRDILNLNNKISFSKSFFVLDMENKRDFSNVEKILKRLFIVVENYNPKEILFLLPPSIESELIMRVTREELEKTNIKNKPLLTRISMGIPYGGSIEFSDERTIKSAIKNRKKIENKI